jgi:hypothetical protein
MNKVETFLSQAGKDILGAIEWIEGVSTTVVKIVPQAAAEVSTVVGDLEDVKEIVIDIEAISNALKTIPGGTPLTGAQKLAASIPKIQQLVLIGLLKGLKVQNPAMLTDGVSDIGQGVVKCLNACEASTGTQAIPTTALAAKQKT